MRFSIDGVMAGGNFQIKGQYLGVITFTRAGAHPPKFGA